MSSPRSRHERLPAHRLAERARIVHRRGIEARHLIFPLVTVGGLWFIAVVIESALNGWQ